MIQRQSKRKAPKDVPSVIEKGIKFMVQTFPSLFNPELEQNGGYVIAQDTVTQKIIWGKYIYYSTKNKNKENDVQDIFITKMFVKHSKLFVENENDELFEVNILNGDTQKIR